MNKRWLIGATVLAFFTGCGGFPAAKVDEAKGHVRRTLEVWQKDGKPDELKAGNPSVEVYETLWTGGDKLVSFELGTARYVEAAQAVRCDAKLTLRNRKGKERTENIAYDVTLGPPVKVVNNPMP